MRILLVHNYYGSSAPSGENVVFEVERDLLRARGHTVETFTRHSDAIRGKGGAGGQGRGRTVGCGQSICGVGVDEEMPCLSSGCRPFPQHVPSCLGTCRPCGGAVRACRDDAPQLSSRVRGRHAVSRRRGLYGLFRRLGYASPPTSVLPPVPVGDGCARVRHRALSKVSFALGRSLHRVERVPAATGDRVWISGGESGRQAQRRGGHAGGGDSA